jgi:Ni/Co efflux regulator RcnB
MKHALLLSAAAAACMACATLSWAGSSSQDHGASQGGQHSDQARGSAAAGAIGRGASAQRGRQATAQGAPGALGRSWTGAATRSSVGVATGQSRQSPHYVAQTAPRSQQYGAAGATRTTSTYAQANVSASHRNVQASQRFNAGAYPPPMGYVSRNWGYGQRLPAAYYARGYWINNYLLYALYGPPSGFVWVRVGETLC